MSILDDVGAAVVQLQQAQNIVARLQKRCGMSPKDCNNPPDITCHNLWNELETIDDKLHEALAKLGD